MTDAAPTRRSRRNTDSHDTKKHRRRFYARWWFWLIVVVILILLIAGAWLATRVLAAKDDLQQAIPMAKTLKSQILADNIPAAKKTLARLDDTVTDARSQTQDPVWRIAEYVPLAGQNLTAVRSMTEITDSLLSDAVKPLMQVAGTLDPSALKPVNGAVNTKPFVAAVPAVHQANSAVQSAVTRLVHVDVSSSIGPVVHAKQQLGSLLGGLSPTLKTLNSVVPLLPGALGADGPRTYLVVFQNLAEARSLGGTGLSVVSVTVDNGAITLGRTQPGRYIPTYGQSVIPVPEGVEAIYADSFGTSVANSTVRPSFTSAAMTIATIWKRAYGESVDGVVSIDPVALSAVIKATGPIPLPNGDKLTAGNVASVLLNKVYLQYPDDNDAQDAVYAAAVSTTFQRVSTGQFDSKTLLNGLVGAWQDRRILFWSAHEDEQKELAKAGLNGELPVSDAETARVGVYFQDDIGSKLDYYLKQSVQLSQATCRQDGKATYRVTAKLTNTEPEDAADVLPPSILGNWRGEHLPPGLQRMTVMLYAPPGSQITGMAVDGKGVQLVPYHDTTYPVAKVRVKFPPGASRTVTFDIVAAKAGTKKLEAQVTPMVHPTTITKGSLDCSAVKSG